MNPREMMNMSLAAAVRAEAEGHPETAKAYKEIARMISVELKEAHLDYWYSAPRDNRN